MVANTHTTQTHAWAPKQLRMQGENTTSLCVAAVTATVAGAANVSWFGMTGCWF
jgi:hypothetical protein